MDPEAVERSVRSAGPATAGTSRHRRRCARGAVSGDAPAQIADRIRSHQYCSWYFSFIENTSFRVTRRVQARVPRKHATYRRYRTARTDTGLRCGAWRGVATNDHTQRVSLYLPRPRPPGCATFACAYRRARAPTGRRQAHKQGCFVQYAQPREARACIQDASCADASGAKQHRQEAGDRDRRSKSFGARAARRVLPQGEEGGVQTTWRASSGPAEAAQAGRRGREKGPGGKGCSAEHRGTGGGGVFTVAVGGRKGANEGANALVAPLR